MPTTKRITPPIKHGTPSGYDRCRPRCEKCKKWRADYVREYRKIHKNDVQTYNRLYAKAMRVLKKRYHDEFLGILRELQEATERELG